MSKIKQIFSTTLDSGNHISMSSKNKKLLVALFAALLLVAAIIGVVVHNNSNSNHNVVSSQSHAIIRSSCSITLYPELCFSVITSEHHANHKVSSQRDVIELSINITIGAVQHNYLTVKKLLAKKGLTKREQTALHDCLETTDETHDELHKTLKDLKEYPTKKSLNKHADDLETLISAAITNQVTCLDGFYDDDNKEIRGALQDGQVHVEQMCSNALAMIKNMTDTDIANYERERGIASRKLVEKKQGIRWPEWMSAGDRRLLQAETVEADMVVAADGSGNFTTVSEAVEAAPKNSEKRFIIKIKAGVYRENVDVPKKKTNIMFLGEGRNNTIITAHRNYVDGSTTFHSATVAAVGEGFLARDITFQNTAGPSKHQAVALRVGADFAAFYRCDILAYQDTLYVHSNRQYFVECLIAGTVDFIFGNAAAVFQDCDIHARRPGEGQKNMVTAQGRVDPNQNTGIVIQKSRIGATRDLEPVKGSYPTYLGRPWKQFSRTVIMQSIISDVIDPVGWHVWNDSSFGLNTSFYREYKNTGPGADTSARVTWEGFEVITNATEALPFTVDHFIAASTWLNSTGFPFSVGL
ncbi:hypothetical protein L6164_004163 [Bauhinia variegata]|uniref:Uncharacterized protein n=1 Tax=Bauhinia variegata TaxID=167791 RepID=A0ACB9Q3S9_BAUVA|nr:hypothetical protein L6164_004163 [Bauhinia variegata]